MSRLITLDQASVAKARAFVESWIGIDGNVEHYKTTRQQGNADRIFQQAVCGKLAEQMVADWLRSLQKTVEGPDYSIYSNPRDKRFEADLKLLDGFGSFKQPIDVHVKAQFKTDEDKFGRSWVFQGHDQLFLAARDNRYKDSDWVAFVGGVEILEDGASGILYYFRPAKDALGVLQREDGEERTLPRSPKLAYKTDYYGNALLDAEGRRVRNKVAFYARDIEPVQDSLVRRPA